MLTLHVNNSQYVMCDQSNGDNTCRAAEVPNPPDIKDILKGISNHVDKKIFRIHVRRKFLWEDFLESRKRPWVKPCHTIKVVFLGEAAIDDGGPKREFFTG